MSIDVIPPIFYPRNIAGQETCSRQYMTWNIDILTHLPAIQPLKSIFKQLSKTKEDPSFMSIINSLQEQAVSIVKYTEDH